MPLRKSARFSIHEAASSRRTTPAPVPEEVRRSPSPVCPEHADTVSSCGEDVELPSSVVPEPMVVEPGGGEVAGSSSPIAAQSEEEGEF